MADSIQVLCPLFDKIEILIPGDSPRFPTSGQNVEFLFVTQRKMTLLKQLLLPSPSFFFYFKNR